MANDVIDLLTVNPTAAYHIKGIINLYTVNFMVDTISFRFQNLE